MNKEEKESFSNFCKMMHQHADMRVLLEKEMKPSREEKMDPHEFSKAVDMFSEAIDRGLESKALIEEMKDE